MRRVDLGIGQATDQAQQGLSPEDHELALTLDVTERVLLAQMGKDPEDYCTLVLDPAGPPKISGYTPTGDLVMVIPFKLPKNVIREIGRAPLLTPTERPVERQTAVLGLSPSGRITVRIDAIEPTAREELRSALRMQKEAIAGLFGENDDSTDDLTE